MLHRGCSDSTLKKITKVTHRALGNNIAEEFLIDKSSVPLLFEIETKQHSHLSVVRLVGWIHLGRGNVAEKQGTKRVRLQSF